MFQLINKLLTNRFFTTAITKAILKNYWPMNNQMIDNITNLSLAIAYDPLKTLLSVTYANNRFQIKNTAIYLTLITYLKAPADSYFSGDFSVTAWIRLDPAVQSFPPSDWTFTLLDFGSNSILGPTDDLIVQVRNDTLYAAIYQNQTFFSTIDTKESANIIKLGVWYHVAFTFGGSTGYLYLNGKQIGNNTNMIVPLNISKPIYIAKPPFSLNVILDDLKIFSGCLNSDQVYNDYDPGI